MIRAVQPVDRLERDGRVVLLYERKVLELSPIADAAIQCAGDWTDLATLTERLVTRFEDRTETHSGMSSPQAELVSHKLRSYVQTADPNRTRTILPPAPPFRRRGPLAPVKPWVTPIRKVKT